MKVFLPTIILRHRKENLKKCSLHGLESRPDMKFYTYPKQGLPNLDGYFLLSQDAPVLTKEDANYGIFLLDGTWKLAEQMASSLPAMPTKRSLPTSIRTAYPRRQTGCIEPETGLASIEALYAAYKILGRDATGLLDQYYWKEPFLLSNEFADDFHHNFKQDEAKQDRKQSLATP